jgi:hypothetical protein
VPSPFDKLRAGSSGLPCAAFEFDLFQAETYGLNRVCAVGKETAGPSTTLRSGRDDKGRAVCVASTRYHSERRALTGSREAARAAGMRVASRPLKRRTQMANNNVQGSVSFTP